MEYTQTARTSEEEMLTGKLQGTTVLNGADVQKPVAHGSLCGVSLGVSAHPGDATTGIFWKDI